MKRPRPAPLVLLVEGATEVRVLPELLEQAGVAWSSPPVFLVDCNGRESLISSENLSTELKASGLEALGILVDADGDPSKVWLTIKQRLAAIDPTLTMTMPKELPTDGVVHAVTNGPRLGVWIMPDNVRSGMLETLLLELRGDASDDLKSHARVAVEKAVELGAKVQTVHLDKAELYTWLSWCDPPDRQLHIAVRGKSIVPGDASTPFVEWFRKLFQV